MVAGGARRDARVQAVNVVPNAEACRIVGITWRTGTRWRHGRTITSCTGKSLHYAPVINTRKTEISPGTCPEDQWVRPPATISRELSRNADPVPGS